MPNKLSLELPRHPLLYITAYLTLATVALIELVIIPAGDHTRWPVTGLLLVFGGLLATKPLFKTMSWQSHLYMALLTGVVAALLLLRTSSLMLPMLFCVLSVIAPMLVAPRTAGLWIIIFILINTFYCAAVWKYEDGWIVSLPYTVGYIFCGTFAFSLARTSAAQRRSESLLAELRVTHQRLQAYAARVEELAVSQERNRLAREMHDALGHRLTVAAVQLEGAERLIPTNPTRAAGMVHTVHGEVVEALAELRRAVATLRTPLAEDLSLLTALTRLTDGFEEATGIKINRLLPETLPPLPDAQRLALYRAAQEALTNVQRHAQARQVWLELVPDNQTITLLLKDDGRGFDLETVEAGFGLRGLRERAAHLKGELHLESGPGSGTQICFHLPLQEDDETSPDPAPVKRPGWKLVCSLSRHRSCSNGLPKTLESSHPPPFESYDKNNGETNN